ncbi:DUF542 domain-containing protein [Anaerococcus porci]|uniref:DUF542 domain-containing protein n=1 Tax=Anaerococcus porci TaxID=2652269 RepID=UPI002A751AAF|nr:DUF542 domain-containing protein [Anaerococcus porci]MDY3005775.1 DUF542 domain-containing protein [Anaerococcus porci]
MNEIKLDDRLNDIVKKLPQSIDYFNKKDIDYCCHGDDSLKIATEKRKLNQDKILSELKEFIKENKSIKNLSIDEFKDKNTKDKISHIESYHHDIEREMLEDIDKLLSKILLVHYKNHGYELKETYTIFLQIKGHLKAHLAKEEKITFPKFENLDCENILSHIYDLEKEHEDMGDLIGNLKKVTKNFTPPKDACNTYKCAFSKLKELTEDIYLHIFKENSILFKEIRRESLI